MVGGCVTYDYTTITFEANATYQKVPGGEVYRCDTKYGNIVVRSIKQ